MVTTLLVEDLDDPEDLVIAEGDAAITAHARLQFKELKPHRRENIRNALLRFCQLDTLAIAVIVQAWKELIHSKLI